MKPNWKKHFAAFFLIVFCFATNFFLTHQANAGLEDNTKLWAWNDNVGWISHNSTDSPSTPAYGVTIDDNTGNFSGWAWNDGFQWIDFAPAGPYPDPNDPGSQHSARVDVTFGPNRGKVTGWAKIVGYGDNGWIKLAGTCGNGCNYGASVNLDNTVAIGQATSVYKLAHAWSGFAWNDITGYIDFAPQFGGVFQNDSPSVNPRLSGWAWNDGFGWISFRYTDYDPTFGINLNPVTNLVHGFAWSPNVGWIQYDPAGPYPGGTGTADSPSTWDPATGNLSGWAKILSLNNNGWISLRDNGYGVVVNKNTGGWSGQAYNDNIGWILYDHNFPAKIMSTDVAGFPPTTPILQNPLGSNVACVNSALVNPTFSWNASAAQNTFNIQVDTHQDFSAPSINFTAVAPAANANYIANGLLANTTYHWRVRIRNIGGVWSPFGATGAAGNELNCFVTPNMPPVVDFAFFPNTPSNNTPVRFSTLNPDNTSKIQVFGGATITRWLWDFGDGQIQDTVAPAAYVDPVHAFNVKGTIKVRLTIFDSSGQQAFREKNISIRQQLPTFRRVIPR